MLSLSEARYLLRDFNRSICELDLLPLIHWLMLIIRRLLGCILEFPFEDVFYENDFIRSLKIFWLSELLSLAILVDIYFRFEKLHIYFVSSLQPKNSFMVRK